MESGQRSRKSIAVDDGIVRMSQQNPDGSRRGGDQVCGDNSIIDYQTIRMIDTNNAPTRSSGVESEPGYARFASRYINHPHRTLTIDERSRHVRAYQVDGLVHDKPFRIRAGGHKDSIIDVCSINRLLNCRILDGHVPAGSRADSLHTHS